MNNDSYSAADSSPSPRKKTSKRHTSSHTHHGSRYKTRNHNSNNNSHSRDKRAHQRSHNAPTRNEPSIPPEIDANDLHAGLKEELRTLDKRNATRVAEHLLAMEFFLDSDVAQALEHARAARDRAGRLASVRQIAGVVAYHNQLWTEAIRELKAARRISGSNDAVHVIADCERALGRPHKALELIHEVDLSTLPPDLIIELKIVESGAYRDQAQWSQAIKSLEQLSLKNSTPTPESARLYYAYAEALLCNNQPDEAIYWFSQSDKADPEGSDAAQRIASVKKI